MSLARWNRLSRSVKFVNPWWSYLLDGYELPGGKRGEYHYVHTGGSSMVVPLTEGGKVLLVNQYRFLLDRESVEFPCGSVKEGSTHDRTAWEELAEETGYSANSLKCVGEFNPYNGITDEICRVYVASDLRFVGGEPDETEEFELLELTTAQLDARIADGSIWDGMTIAAWTIARQAALASRPGEGKR